MMRQTALRRITSYEFGHPHMGTGFGCVIMNTRNPDNIVDHGVQRTKLPNGVTVITHDKSGAASALGFYADAGVQYDSYKIPGTTDLLKWSMFSGNVNSSTFQIDRAFRSIGSTFTGVELNKKWVGALTYGQRTGWRVAVEHLSTTFAAPRFAMSDLEKWRDHADNARQELRWTQPRVYAVDELETVAFYREPLGNSRTVHPVFNDKITTEVLLEKYATYFNPNRVTIVGVNIPHQDLIAEYNNQPYPHSASAPHHERATTPLTAGSESIQYQGGKERYEYENRVKAMETKANYEQETIAAIGWNTVGQDTGLVEYAAALVYTEMLNIAAGNSLALSGAHGLRAFYRPFSTTGLIGFTSVTKPSEGKDAIKKALKTTPTDFVAHLPAAKARAVASLFNSSLETDTDYANFLVSSSYGAAEILAAIEATSVSQVANIVDSIKSAKPTIYATGDTAKLPSLRRLLH